MPAKIDDFWKEQLLGLKSNSPDWGAVRLYAALNQEAAKLGRTDAPSQGWISQWLRKEWPLVTDAQRRDYRSFYWPESMIRGDLPWEASIAALELLLFLDCNGVRERPPIRLVKWYWYVQTASPDMSRAVILNIAVKLARQEEKGESIGDRGAEWYMAYHHVPQLKGQDDPLEERRKRYSEAKNREDDPIPPYETARLSITTEGEMDPRFWIDLLLVTSGVTPVRKRLLKSD
jgi:hypothetical protein